MTYLEGGFESETGVGHEPRLGLLDASLLPQEDGGLLLEASLGLNSQ